MKRLGRWFWALLAVGSWVACAVLADAQKGASTVLFVSAFGWFFIAIAVGGWKGLPFGIIPLVFVGCASAVWTFFLQAPKLIGSKTPVNVYGTWQQTKVFLDTLQDKPWVLVGIYIGLIIVILGILVIPVAVAVKLGKAAKEKKPTEDKKAAEKAEEKKKGPVEMSAGI